MMGTQRSALIAVWERRGSTWMSRPREAGNRAAGMDGAEPGFQQPHAEGEDAAGLGEVVAQRARRALHELMRQGGLLRSEAADADVVRRAVGGGEALPDRVAVPAILTSQDHHRVSEALGAQL